MTDKIDDRPGDTPRPASPAGLNGESVAKLDAFLSEALRYVYQRQELTRKEIVWNNLRRTMIILFFVALLAVQVAFLARTFLGGRVPVNTGVAIIGIEGVIDSQNMASADKVVPLIEKACQSEAVQHVVLAIDSPGGSPHESERIVRSVEQCRAEHSKKFTALIGSTGASAAYMIAIHADQIVAGNYSIVGSIGAIMRYVDAHGAVEKLGLSERVFRSGVLKGGPSMFSRSTPEMDAVNQEMVTVLGRDFLAEVLAARKDKIAVEGDQLFSGRIWSGPQALELGLVDRIATLEDLKATDFKGMQVTLIKPKSPFAEGFGARAILAGALQDVLTNVQEPKVQ